MKVTIVHGSNDSYGASRVLLQEIACLISLGHSVHLLVPTHGPLKDQLALLNGSVQVTVIPDLLILRRARLTDVLRIPRLPIAMRTADVVVLWTLGLASYVPLLRLARKKFYVSVHELLEDRAARWLFRLALKGSFPITACSFATSAWLKTLGIPDKRIFVTYPVLEAGPSTVGQATESSEKEKATFTVAVFGRVNGHKGHLEVAKAFQSPLLSDGDWRLILAGAPFPGQEKALHEVLSVAASDGRIAYVGELESIRELDDSTDLVAVFPTKPEPFGLVPIEAWSSGIRSIGFDDGGAAEVLPMVGGTRVTRTESPIEAIAVALASARSSQENMTDLPSLADVQSQLSFKRRKAALSAVLSMATKTMHQSLFRISRNSPKIENAPDVE